MRDRAATVLQANNSRTQSENIFLAVGNVKRYETHFFPQRFHIKITFSPEPLLSPSLTTTLRTTLANRTRGAYPTRRCAFHDTPYTLKCQVVKRVWAGENALLFEK